MNYFSYCEDLQRMLKKHGYAGVDPAEPLDLAMMNTSSFQSGTKVVAACHPYGYDYEPEDIYKRSQDWFQSLIGNNGAGLLVYVYDAAPAWAVDIIKNFSGEVYGATIDLENGATWIPSHLGWDRLFED